MIGADARHCLHDVALGVFSGWVLQADLQPECWGVHPDCAAFDEAEVVRARGGERVGERVADVRGHIVVGGDDVRNVGIRARHEKAAITRLDCLPTFFVQPQRVLRQHVAAHEVVVLVSEALQKYRGLRPDLHVHEPVGERVDVVFLQPLLVLVEDVEVVRREQHPHAAADFS